MTKVDLTKKVMITRGDAVSITYEDLSSVKKTLDYLIEKYGEKVYFVLEEEYGGTRVFVEYQRLETDEEYEHRLSAMKRQEDREKEQ